MRRQSGRGFTGAMPSTVQSILQKVNVNTLSQLQGGWEGWLQVEIAVAYMQAGFNATREAHPYPNNALRADLELTSNNTDIVVEVKCRSVGQANFHNNVLADYDKLVTLPQQRIGVLVAVVDQTTVQALRASRIADKLPSPVEVQNGWFLYVYTGVT
jgi:hypothetical protein